ncbi:putative damage-inducible protein DinB [Marmoricola sp. OAE513]|uniref:DinB family protein n=1 Tax=Marmoricola sp. OAE513 TaxID=2817894 RepID=UPI001AE6A06F
MAETQREPVPRVDTGELDTALAFLDFARHCLIKKLEGLDEEQLRRRLVDSETNLLGLVQHCAAGERWWFAHHLGGDPSYAETDFTMLVPEDRTAEEVIADFHAAVAESDRHIAAAGSPEALTALHVDGQPKTLRWVLAHTTSELIRHVGHADILREQVDGTTGR